MLHMDDDEKVSKIEVQFDSPGTPPEDMRPGNFYYMKDGTLILSAQLDDDEAVVIVVISSPDGTYRTGDIIGLEEEELLSFVDEVKIFVKIKN